MISYRVLSLRLCIVPLVALIFSLGSSPASAEETAEKGKWVSLFNGKDLEGWTPKIRFYEYGENYGNTFRVEDGVLKV